MDENQKSDVSYPSPNAIEIEQFVAAAGFGELEEIQAYLKEFGATAIDHKSLRGATALQVALALKQNEAALLLLNAGAGIEVLDSKGYTCLPIAVCSGRTDMVQALLARGANVNHRGECGATSLMWAVRMQFLEIARQLLDAGADITIADDNGRTAQDWAEDSNNPGVKTIITGWVVEKEEERCRAAAQERAIQAAAAESRISNLKRQKNFRSPLRRKNG